MSPSTRVTEQYILRGGREGRERLRVLSRAMEPTTRSLLVKLGIKPGARCLDAGCGGGDVSLELARLATAVGWVVGIDIDDTKLEIARREAEFGGFDNVQYHRAAIENLGHRHAYDVAYARFLLSHLVNPVQALDTMVSVTRPGGVVAVEDVDFAASFCHPVCRAYSEYCDLYRDAADRRGVDPNIGRRLPGMFLAAGLTNVGVNVAQPAGFDVDIKMVSPLTLENIADSVVDLGLIARDEVTALVADLYAFAADPTTILSLPRIVQVWGTVPAKT